MNQKKITDLYLRSSSDWDERVISHPFIWMSEATKFDSEFWQSGARDFSLLSIPLPASITGTTALEFGCGTGRLLREASSHFASVIGIDISKEAIKLAQQALSDLSNVSLHHSLDPALLFLKSQSIDIAYSYGVMGVLSPGLFLQSLASLSRVTKNGGLVAIQLYLGNEHLAIIDDSLAIRCYEVDRFKETANLLGLTMESNVELTHPTGDISKKEEGIVAQVALLRKDRTVTPDPLSLQKALCDGQEAEASKDWEGSKLEYLLAITKAQEFISEGRYSEARALFEFAKSRYSNADPSSKDILLELDKVLRADTTME